MDGGRDEFISMMRSEGSIPEAPAMLSLHGMEWK